MSKNSASTNLARMRSRPLASDQNMIPTDSKKFEDEAQAELILRSTSNTPTAKTAATSHFNMFGGLNNAVFSIVKAAQDRAKKELLPLCTPRIVLGKYGPGYPLYFEYIFVCGLLLVLMFFVVSIHSLYYNHKGTTCAKHLLDKDHPCRGGVQVIYSIANRAVGEPFKVSSMLNLAFTVVSLVLAFFYRKVQAKTADQVDDNAITAADYTVMVRGIPETETAEDIRRFFQENGRDGTPVKVVRVCMAYQIYHYVDLVKKRELLKKKQSKGKFSPTQVIKLAETEQEIKEIRDHAGTTPVLFTGVAFVSFNTQKETTDVINKFSMGAIQGLVYSTFGSSVICCCWKNSKKLYNNRVISVVRSFEPNDIFWENLGLPGKVLMKKKMVNLLGNAALIILCFAMIFGIKYLQAFAAIHTKIKFVAPLLSFIGSASIIVVNAALGSYVRKLAKYERPETHTSYQVNVAESLSMAQFFNTAFVTLIVEFLQERKFRLWVPDGIVPSFFFVFILNAFVPSLLKYFNVGYFLKSLKRKKALNKPSPKMTSEQADKLFKDPEFDVALLYANIQKTMMFTAFYACLIPLGVLFSIGGLALTYWADKYVFLRRTGRPNILGKVLAEEMADYLELIIVCFCAGNMLFEKIAVDNISTLNFIAMLVAVGVMILPNGTVAACLFPEKENNEDTQNTYEDSLDLEIFHGYHEMNPVIQDQKFDDNIQVRDFESGIDRDANVNRRPNPQTIDFDTLDNYILDHEGFLHSQRVKNKQQGKEAAKPTLASNPAFNPIVNQRTISSTPKSSEGKRSFLEQQKQQRLEKQRQENQRQEALKIQEEQEVRLVPDLPGHEDTPLEATPLARDTFSPKYQDGDFVDAPQRSKYPKRTEKPKALETKQMRVRGSVNALKRPTIINE